MISSANSTKVVVFQSEQLHTSHVDPVGSGPVPVIVTGTVVLVGLENTETMAVELVSVDIEVEVGVVVQVLVPVLVPVLVMVVVAVLLVSAARQAHFHLVALQRSV